MGAEMRVHDPYVDRWWEFENQDEYPALSKAVHFRNQKKLKDLRVHKDLDEVLRGIDALVLAVRHEPYLELDPDAIVRSAGHPIAVVDCFGILDDRKITRYFELGCEVKGLGRGHIQRIKDHVRRTRT
jgi:UDP-N-acetyl-D-mannosaminuronate dehydrogenase